MSKILKAATPSKNLDSELDAAAVETSEVKTTIKDPKLWNDLWLHIVAFTSNCKKTVNNHICNKHLCMRCMCIYCVVMFYLVIVCPAQETPVPTVTATMMENATPFAETGGLNCTYYVKKHVICFFIPGASQCGCVHLE